jgi:hypothetical protein
MAAGLIQRQSEFQERSAVALKAPRCNDEQMTNAGR